MVKDETEHISMAQDSPSDTFKRMAVNDGMQNKNLASKLNKKSPSYVANSPQKVTYMRFLVCILGVLSLAMSQMNRMVINICIPSMVDPSMLKPKDHVVGGADSCPAPEELSVPTTICPLDQETLLATEMQTESTPSPLATIDPLLYLITSQSSVDETVVSNSSVTITELITQTEVLVDRFRWDMDQQSYLLGGFFWSYFLFMILGGWIAETYGAKYVLLTGVAGSSIISLLTPYLARNSLTLLVCSRILMGALQSGVFPAMYAVIAKWLTMSEASIFAPMIKMNLRLGMLMASAVPGMVSAWPNVFYLTGIASSIWSLAWFILSTSNPVDNKWVSEQELNHILKKKRKLAQLASVEDGLELSEQKGTNGASAQAKKLEKANPPPTPWFKILTNPSVIGLIIVKFTFNTGADFLSIELPSYLAYVHHVHRKRISIITSFMFGIQVALVVFVGWLAKDVVKKRPFGMTKTTIRKIFQSLANFGVGSCLLLITFNDCNLIYVIVLLQFTSFLSMFGAGGETMLPYDLSDQYPATIMAIANSVANLSGLTVTSLAGKILGGHGGSYSRWNLLIYLISGANIFGGLSFVSLIKAEPIDFEGTKKKGNKDVDRDVEKAPTNESAVKVEPPSMTVAFATEIEAKKEKNTIDETLSQRVEVKSSPEEKINQKL